MPKRNKRERPKDINQIAHHLVELSTTESDKTPIPPPTISEYMSTIGRKGGKIGGKRRMETMSAKQRRSIAKRAAEARWESTKK